METNRCLRSGDMAMWQNWVVDRDERSSSDSVCVCVHVHMRVRACVHVVREINNARLYKPYQEYICIVCPLLPL